MSGDLINVKAEENSMADYLLQVGKETLGGLLALGYQIAVSYKRESEIIDDGTICICIETIDDLEKTFVLVKGKERKV